jgi:hypothetical protein
MATIKAKNGKVLLKNGKAACKCCVPNCGELGLSIGEDNLFQITEKEYIDYHNGGNWRVVVTDTFYRSVFSFSGWEFTTSGYGSKEFNYQKSGCSRSFSSGFSYPLTTIYPDDDRTYTSSSGYSFHEISYLLQIINKNFYIKFGTFFSWANFGTLPPEHSSFFYTGNVEGTINGNTIKMHSVWNDLLGSFAREYGLPYINNSICTLEVTFTPNK